MIYSKENTLSISSNIIVSVTDLNYFTLFHNDLNTEIVFNHIFNFPEEKFCDIFCSIWKKHWQTVSKIFEKKLISHVFKLCFRSLWNNIPQSERSELQINQDCQQIEHHAPIRNKTIYGVILLATNLCQVVICLSSNTSFQNILPCFYCENTI